MNWASWDRTNVTAVKVLCLNHLAIAHHLTAQQGCKLLHKKHCYSVENDFVDDGHDYMHVCAIQCVLTCSVCLFIHTGVCQTMSASIKKATTQNKFGRRRKKEKENKKKVRHGGLEPPTT